MKKSIICNVLIITCVLILVLICFPVQVSAAHLHLYTYNKTVSATCTTGKYMHLKCKCGATQKVKLSDAKGHSYKTVKQEATSTKNGYIKTYCTRCNSVKENTVIQASKISKWNGKTYTKPTKTSGDYLLINSAEEFAWVLKKQNTNGKSKIKINYSIDMANYSFSPLPNKITVFNGNNKTIKNLKITGTGLFGNSKGLSVSNLTLDNVKITSSANAGVLVGTLTGNSTFKNCKIINSSIASSKGYAGGFVGYIVRSTETDRSKSLAVKLDTCHVENTKISGTLAEGKFVGALSGYDQKETLTFTKCSANTKVADYSSYYIAANQSKFLKSIDSKYNGFLGTEKYHRGVITFDTKRFIPKWDGKTSVQPLSANTKYDGKNATEGFVVYSPFDMAGIRAKTDSPKAIHLKENIDMNGQGVDGKYNVPSNFKQSKYKSTDDNNFTPFKAVATFDGNNKTIYNLAIFQLEKETGALILSASGKTIHKNIKFNSCQTVSTHKPVKTDAKAYGAILISNTGGTSYTMQNVTATNCKVFALQKVGTLAGRLGADNNIVQNCTVSNCYIENYICKISETFSSKQITYGPVSVRVMADFYPHGEVGGMFGFVQNNATISKCNVTKTNIYGYGQNDKQATILGSKIAIKMISSSGYYIVPGRHVSTFIGDIRATGNVNITNCNVDSASKCLNRYDKHNNTYNYIGQAYIVKFVDVDRKTVKIDTSNLTIADCNKSTQR